MEDKEYSYRRDLPVSQSSLVPLHHNHGSPRMADPFNYGMHSGYSGVEESLRAEDYATYRLVRPLTCDHLPPVTQMSSGSFPKYLLTQPSPYQHVLGQSYSSISSPWPSQEAYHYGMASGEICRAVASISCEEPEGYSLERYSTHQAFLHHNVICDVNHGGQVVMLNHCSPSQINHTMMASHSTESLPHPSSQGHPTECCSLQGNDSGHTVKTECTGSPQNHLQSSGVTFNLKPGPYASQTVGQIQKSRTKGRERSVNLEKWKRPCNCTKSQCLKLYCECFANGEFCKNCKCINCFNNTEHEPERCQAIKVCLDRNPGAFRPKIGSRKQGNVKGHHTKGCNCKRSGCLKNYCECYEANIMCTSTCKCVGCQNYEESPRKKRSACGPDSSIYCPTRSPLAGITPDVVEATCGCLLAQAEEAEKERYILPHAEKMILEEFGQCMTQIVQSIFKSTMTAV